MPMKNPRHLAPLCPQYIEPLALTISEAAAVLGVARSTLSELVNGKRGISPDCRSQFGVSNFQF
jgi:plasmid maintenance system antidote protein VapI